VGQYRWWVLSFLAALILLGSAGGFLWQMRGARRLNVAPPPPAPRVRCPNVDEALPALKDEPIEVSALIVGATGVRAFLDGKPALGTSSGPFRVTPGEHVLRAEGEGAEPFELRLRFEPPETAMVHLQLDPEVGLTVALLGATCPSCPPPGEKLSLDFTRTSDTDAPLLADAAKALRVGEWRRAGSRLRGVSAKARAHGGYLRLAGTALALSGDEPGAVKSFEKVPKAEAHGLDAVLDAWSTLSASETLRHGAGGMRKWNHLTEKFSALAEQFALDAPGPVELATSRFAELTEGFLKASQVKDTQSQTQTVQAAEDALGQFVRALRRSRPDDCEFQTRISAAL
jgi:hypothetical protein